MATSDYFKVYLFIFTPGDIIAIVIVCNFKEREREREERDRSIGLLLINNEGFLHTIYILRYPIESFRSFELLKLHYKKVHTEIESTEQSQLQSYEAFFHPFFSCVVLS